MTQEEKQLLLKDLCARLPYGVKVHTWYNKPIDIKCTGVDVYTNVVNLDIPEDDAKVYIDNVKPYLRPMSSMMEEEQEEFRTLILPEASCAYEDCLEWDAQIVGGGCLQISVEDFSNVIDWLNAHHFDYRGLIQIGLALEAPKGMYKTE